MKTLAVPFIALTLAIGGCASMGGGEAEEKKIEVVTDNLEKVQGSKEVYLGQFSVTFVTKDKASATSESGMFSRITKTKIRKAGSAIDHSSAALTLRWLCIRDCPGNVFFFL